MLSIIKEDCYGSSIYSYTNGIFFSKGDIVKVIYKKHDFYEVEAMDGRRFYVENSFLDTSFLDIGDGSASVTEPLITLANIANEKDIGSATTSKIDGSNGSYYDNKVPDWLVDQWLDDSSVNVTLKAEHVIEFVFKDNFDFGNCYKALVRAVKSLEGCGKSGNTLEYEMDKVIYYANKVKEKAQRNAAIDE